METSQPASSKKRSISLEQYKVVEYKLLGFTPYQAQKLAKVPGLGVETVKAVLNKGCSLKLAYRIYRP